MFDFNKDNGQGSTSGAAASGGAPQGHSLAGSVGTGSAAGSASAPQTAASHTSAAHAATVGSQSSIEEQPTVIGGALSRISEALHAVLPYGQSAMDAVLSACRAAMTNEGWSPENAPKSIAVVIGASTLLISTYWIVYVSCPRACFESQAPTRRLQSGENATELRKDIIVKRPNGGDEDPSAGRHVNFNIPLSVLRG